MRSSGPHRQSPWRLALRQPAIWQRAVRLGLTVGTIQAVVNQGDIWWRHAETTETIIKTIASPLIGFLLVLVTAVWTWTPPSSTHSNPS